MEKQMKIDEAIYRMKKLDLYDGIIDEFSKKQKLEYSEPTPLGGILYWVDNNPDWMNKVKDFEGHYNALVYHVIHSYTEFGELLNLLYISDYEEEWEMERDELSEGYVFSYVMNLDYPEFSEFGSILVKEAAGGLKRIG